MKKLFLALGFLVFVDAISAQEKGFFSIYKDPEGILWSPYDVIETDFGDYWISAVNYNGTQSKLFSISPNGVISDGIVVEEEGMYVLVTEIISHFDASGDLLALAVCRQVANGSSALMILRLDSGMNIVQRHLVSFPFGERPIKDIKFMKKIGGLIASVTFGQQPPFDIFLAEISFDGEIIKYIRCDMDSLITVCNLFPVHGGTNQIGMFACTSENSNAMMGVLVFNENLELIFRIYFPQWDCGENFMYLNDHGNSSVLPLPDSVYVLSSRMMEFSTMQHDQSTMFAIIDDEFNLQDYTVIGHLNDTVEYPAFYRSVDYFDRLGNLSIYQCTMQNITQGWPLQFVPLHLVVTKTDADLNIEWQKCFLTDGNAYTPFTMTTTSDGGCLIVGEVYDYNHNYRWDLFALKIDADGTVGVKEIQEGSMASVYPNPAKETIRMVGVKAKETKVYNVLGQHVMSFGGNEADVKALAAGIYLLRVIEANGNVQMLRAVVTK